MLTCAVLAMCRSKPNSIGWALLLHRVGFMEIDAIESIHWAIRYATAPPPINPLHYRDRPGRVERLIMRGRIPKGHTAKYLSGLHRRVCIYLEKL